MNLKYETPDEEIAALRFELETARRVCSIQHDRAMTLELTLEAALGRIEALESELREATRKRKWINHP